MELLLQKAESQQFASYFATYNKNIWFRQSWDQLKSLVIDAKQGYWILNGSTKVAGLIMEENSLSCLFALPPYHVDTSELLKVVIESMKRDYRLVNAYCVLDQQVEGFMSFGFDVTKTRSCMIRPTEPMEFSIPNGYSIIHPTPADASAIIDFLYEAYLDCVDEESFEETSNSINNYFLHNDQRELRLASSIIFNRTGTVAGVCLISLWEDLPLIYDVAVSSKDRGKGLGSIMIAAAINALNDKYPLIRLFVTSGNHAKKLYSKLGFLCGGAYSTLSLTIDDHA